MVERVKVARQHFVDQVDGACASMGARVTWHSERWIAEIAHGSGQFFVIGQTFPLNDAASANIANDKAATYSVLSARTIAAVPHHMARFGLLGDVRGVAGFVRSIAGLPVVLKPHRESAGIDVVRAHDDAELVGALEALAAKYRAITVSPFLRIRDETRVVVLDSEVLLTYRKVVADGPEWRHNLCCGAKPEVIPVSDRDDRMTELALRAMDALRLRFATVDVVDVDGELSVLEVNSGVTLEHFSRSGAEQEEAAREIYRRALLACAGSG